MAAPDSTVWGSIVGDYCRLGIYKNITSTNTTTSATIEVWFWSKYSCTDTNNTLYYDNKSSSGSATTSQGAVSIGTTYDSGSGWSTTNQVKLKTYTYSYTRGTSATTRYLYAKLANVDKVKNVAIYASTTFTVPALTTYTVSYNANNGSGAPTSQTKYYGKALTLSTVKPTRSGYAFKGWATSASGSVAYASGASYTANANVTLYAVWQANTWTVSYNANGGTGAPSSQTKQLNVNLTLSSTKPTRENYKFVGWTTSPSATTATYQAGGTYTNNASVTLYAVWELSLYPPKITNLKVYRFYDDWGVPDDNGQSMCLTFDYEQSPDGHSDGIDPINIRLNPADDWGESDYYLFNGVDYDIDYQGEKKGSVVCLLWTEALLPDVTYQLTIDIYDAIYNYGNTGVFTTISTVLEGTKFAFDAKSGATGAAVGKNAELDGVFDIGYEARFFKGIRHMIIPENTDLNNILMPNTYIGANLSHYKYLNCPLSSGTFTLIVEGCGEDGQICQTLRRCSKTDPWTWYRFYYQGEWGAWLEITASSFKVLYNNTSGTTGVVTLSESAANYETMEIFFTDNNGKTGGYTKILNPNGKTAHLHIIEPGNAVNTYIRRTSYAISGTSITPDAVSAGYWRFSGETHSHTCGTNYIKIVRVVGRNNS